MQYRFFAIPAIGTETKAFADEMNAFICGHKVLSVQRELITTHETSYWCCCVEYIEGTKTAECQRNVPREKIDYRKLLKDEDFERFCLFRECRKLLAMEEAIPAYAIFLDEHLAEFSKKSEITVAAMKTVNGVGEKKIEKYAKRFIELVEQKQHEAGGQSLSPDSGN